MSNTVVRLGIVTVLACALPISVLSAAALVEVTELLAHPDHYDHQVVTVSGRVTSFQLATNRDGQPAFGFLLQDTAGTVKVVGLGKSDVREGDYVVVEGIFSRLRQPVALLCITRSRPHRSSRWPG